MGPGGSAKPPLSGYPGRRGLLVRRVCRCVLNLTRSGARRCTVDARGLQGDDALQGPFEVCAQLGARRCGCLRHGPDHDVTAPGKAIQEGWHEPAESAYDAMPGDGIPDRLAHREGRPGRCRCSCFAHLDVDDDGTSARAAAMTNGAGDIRARVEAITRGQHVGPPCSQADRRVRPLPRRAARMARPARVRMRVLKPCVRARRRLLGWKVRFDMSWLLLASGHGTIREPHEGTRGLGVDQIHPDRASGQWASGRWASGHP